MNPKTRELRMHHADHLRARALHDLSRAREALALIRDIAEAPADAPPALRSIALIARAALAGATPPDAAFLHGEEHKGNTS
ncbi:conserved hypothetical protein [Paraburkholderia unamae]|uniref:hypothetical protein n=1 Tax=Paraburkholderia unamae TaxID=219649 RepID=UPI001CAEE9D3|nr:hypothetical protein [Paraburkholderia unamae]CAG9258482.1 conserved hypothetical protein [Paraburkholderia unamae]